MKKNAFSLIEIVQTIVLLGIIAGLAVSFFKNFKPNDKLFFATQTLMEQAVQQAKRDMCNDQSPAYENGAAVTLCDTTACNAILGGSAYNETTGYCEIAAAGGACANGTGQDTDLDGIIDLCYTPPTSTGAPGGPDCRPVREYFCPTPDNVRFSNNNRQNITTVNNITVPILCYYLHQILNHKTQATNAADSDTDLRRTCNVGAAWDTAFTNATTLDAVRVAAAINTPQSDRYSMLLPNGVRLYNLGYVMPLGGTQKIFVKYDGLDDIDSSVLDTTNNGAANKVSNIKNSTVWCIKVTDAGVVSSCDLGD